jgi:hypothetical protein
MSSAPLCEIINQPDYYNVKLMFVGPGAERDKLAGETSRTGLKNVIFVTA